MSIPHPLHRPYPNDVYTGEGGEASAWLRADDTPPELEYRNGGTCEYLATGDQTGGLYGLYRWTFGEAQSGPEPHFHRAITSNTYWLEVARHNHVLLHSIRDQDHDHARPY